MSAVNATSNASATIAGRGGEQLAHECCTDHEFEPRQHRGSTGPGAPSRRPAAGQAVTGRQLGTPGDDEREPEQRRTRRARLGAHEPTCRVNPSRRRHDVACPDPWQRCSRQRQRGVDLVVAVVRVVVEQRELLAPDVTASHAAYSDGAVPPVDFIANSARVYCASWIRRSTPSHSSSALSVARVHVDPGLLVVAQVGDRQPPPTPIGSPACCRRAGSGATCTAMSPIEKSSSPFGVELDVAGQLVEIDREHRRTERVADHVADRRAVLLDRRVEVEDVPVAQQRWEERQALHVVPVQVVIRQLPSNGDVGGALHPEVAQRRCRGRTGSGRARARRRRRTTCCRRTGQSRRRDTASTHGPRGR